MKMAQIAFLALCLVTPSISPANETYTISYGGVSGFQAPVWAAKDLGLLDKYGLSAEVVMIAGSSRGIQALVGGTTQFAARRWHGGNERPPLGSRYCHHNRFVE